MRLNKRGSEMVTGLEEAGYSYRYCCNTGLDSMMTSTSR